MLLILWGLGMVGCSAGPEQVVKEHRVVEVYKTLVSNQIKAVEKVSLIFQKYGISPKAMVSFNTYPRNSTSQAQLVISDYVGLSNIVDQKLYTKRIETTSYGSSREVSLKEELEEVAREYNDVIESLTPEYKYILSLPGVTTNEEGDVVIGGDMVISRKSLHGILTIELLEAQARGENIDTIIEDMNKAFEEVTKGYVKLGNGESQNGEMELNLLKPKGFYLNDTKPWLHNTITYKFENINDTLKNATIEAMNDWSNKVAQVAGRALIKFEPDYSWWTDFLTSISLYGKLVIREDSSIEGAGGWANIGWGTGWRYMTFNTSITTRDMLLRRVPRHELGHVLGLSHEHQRGDRDEYVNVDMSKIPDGFWKSQYEKIPFFIERQVERVRFWIEWVHIWWIFYVPVPRIDRWWETEREEKSKAPTPYDYFSIMHYDGRFNNQKVITFKKWVTNVVTNTIPDGGIIIDTNIYPPGNLVLGTTNITYWDAYTVKSLYENRK